jgi:hypothetical protein
MTNARKNILNGKSGNGFTIRITRTVIALGTRSRRRGAMIQSVSGNGFYLRAVCQNRNLWGVDDFMRISRRSPTAAVDAGIEISELTSLGRLVDLRDSYSAGAGCSITSTATASTAAATGGTAFFAAARLGLALATIRFAAFPAAFLALGRAVRPFFFWTFDECFLRLAMVHPCSDWRDANALMPDQRTIGQPFYEFSTRTQLGLSQSLLQLVATVTT